MKSILCLFLLAAAALAAPDARLAQVHKVYLLPMTNGLDQYLASRITAAGALAVVTDPSQADAVFTDRLGEAFETRLRVLFPPPKPEAKPAASGKLGDTEQSESQAPLSSFRRSKGTVFLVDVKSRTVIWSIYDRPQNATADEMNRTASRVVTRLRHDLSRK